MFNVLGCQVRQIRDNPVDRLGAGWCILHIIYNLDFGDVARASDRVRTPLCAIECINIIIIIIGNLWRPIS